MLAMPFEVFLIVLIITSRGFGHVSAMLWSSLCLNSVLNALYVFVLFFSQCTVDGINHYGRISYMASKVHYSKKATPTLQCVPRLSISPSFCFVIFKSCLSFMSSCFVCFSSARIRVNCYVPKQPFQKCSSQVLSQVNTQ